MKSSEDPMFAILVDFDGTITREDSNDELIKSQQTKKIEEITKIYNRGLMSDIEFTDSIFREIKISEEDYLEFILNEINMTNGFKDFYKLIKELNIPIAIVSGGFENGIIPFLHNHSIYDIKVYANSLEFDGKDIKVNYYDDEKNLSCDNGPCGNCKVKHYNYYKDLYDNIVFIGDGYSDNCVAKIADIVFAKSDLLDYCKEIGLDCIEWNDFYLIINVIKDRYLNNHPVKI